MARFTGRQSLEYFFQVAKCGSIRAASDQLRIAPSAISRMVAQLEDEFGLQLLIRQPRGVQLTDAGRYVYRYMQESHARDALLHETLSDLRGLKRGVVRVATGSGFVPGLISSALSGFAASYPMIQVEVINAGTEGILGAVLEDEAEIGIVFGPFDDRGVEIVREIEEPLEVFVAPAHDLAKGGARSLAEVARIPLALPPVSSGIRQVVDGIYHGLGIAIRPALTIGLVQGQVSFAVSGAGGTFLPAFCCSREIQNGRLVAVRLADKALLETRACLFTRRNRNATPATQVLLDHLRISFPFRV